MSLDGIRAGIVANLRGQWPDGVQVGKYILAQPSPPTLHIRHGGVDYDLAMGRGMDDLTMIVQGLVTLGEPGQRRLDEWMDSGAGGVKRAIETDHSLGGTVDDIRVTGASPPIVATVGGVEVLLVEWSITVYPRGA